VIVDGLTAMHQVAKTERTDFTTNMSTSP